MQGGPHTSWAQAAGSAYAGGDSLVQFAAAALCEERAQDGEFFAAFRRAHGGNKIFKVIFHWYPVLSSASP